MQNRFQGSASCRYQQLFALSRCEQRGQKSRPRQAAGVNFPFPTENYSCTLRFYRSLSTSNLGVRYTESGKKSSHVRACQYEKQSFINKSSVKLISQAGVLRRSRVLP
jgi:hypothetical protein